MTSADVAPVAPPETASAARAVWFTKARTAEIRVAAAPLPLDTEVTVRAISSLISAGTELAVYRGEVTGDLGRVPLDDGTMAPVEGSFDFPIKYGYQVVGEVIAAGPHARVAVGDLVFAGHPHQTVFTMSSHPLLMSKLPAGLAPGRAVFAHLLAVALTSQLDVPTGFGDCVAVFGLGVVGSLIAQLVRRTAATVIVVDPVEGRRQQALAAGADVAVPPESARDVVLDLTGGRGVDRAYEASGVPSAVQSAIEVTGQEGVIVEVSYFGNKVVPLILAPQFHFRRQHIISSQANPYRTDFPPRWDWSRIQEEAFALLGTEWLQTPSALRMAFGNAAQAYQLLDRGSLNTVGVLLDYS